MITISEVVERIIRRSPFLEEALQEGIVNYSALARDLKPEIQKTLFKDVQEGAILMALRRLSTKKSPNISLKKLFTQSPDVIVRSNVIEITINSTTSSQGKYKELLGVQNEKNHFLTISQGVFETTIIASRELKEVILNVFKGERIIATLDDLASLTIRLPQETINMPTVYYQIIKSLAWEGINIVEVVSTYTELTIILSDKDIGHAFSVIKGTVK